MHKQHVSTFVDIVTQMEKDSKDIENGSKEAMKGTLSEHPAAEEFRAYIEAWEMARNYYSLPSPTTASVGKPSWNQLWTLRYLGMLKIRLEKCLNPAIVSYATTFRTSLLKPPAKILDFLRRSRKGESGFSKVEDLESYLNFRKHYVLQDLIDAARDAGCPFTTPGEEALRKAAAKIESYGMALWVLNDANLLRFLVTNNQDFTRTLNSRIHMDHHVTRTQDDSYAARIRSLEHSVKCRSIESEYYLDKDENICLRVLRAITTGIDPIMTGDFCDQLQARSNATISIVAQTTTAGVGLPLNHAPTHVGEFWSHSMC